MKTALIFLTTILSYLMPIALLIFWQRKTKCNLKAYLVGAICFFAFSNVLEGFVNFYLLGINKTTSTFIMSSPFLYAIFGGLMAGLFEETGRLFGFKVLLKKQKTKSCAVAYGIGHGGIECVMVLGATYIMYSILLLKGSVGDPALDKSLLATIETINTSTIPLALLERVFAIMIHIALSILVYKASVNKKDFYLYPISILLHLLSDVPAGLYQAGLLDSIFVGELLIGLIAIVLFATSIQVYKNIKEDNIEQ